MSVSRLVLACCCWGLLASPTLEAQRPGPPPDSLKQGGDSLNRPIQLQEITVTATPTRRETPQTAISISPAVIQRAPALDAWDLLRQVGGVEVHLQGQGPGFASDASLRGFSSDHSTDIALWVDGVPVNEPVNGHAEGYNDWSLLFPQTIRDMEIIKGPTSALFGNFSVAGTVNVRTLDRMSGASGSLSGGSYGRLEGNFLTGLDRPGTGGVLAARYERDGGWRPNGKYDLGQLYGRLVRDVSPNVSVDAGVGLYLTGWDSPGFITVEQFERSLFDTMSNGSDGGFKRRAQERVSLRVLANPRLSWRSTLYGTQGRWQLFLTIPPEGGLSEGSGSQTEEEDTRYGFGMTSALTWSLPRAEITTGVEGRWDRADYQNFFTTNRIRDSVDTDLSARQLSGGAFVQALFDPIPRLRLSAGARYDGLDTRSTPVGNSTTGHGKGIVSPKLGALVKIAKEASLYANVSRGFRQTDGVIRDPTLPFISVWAYETGVKLDGRRWNAEAAVFRTDVSDEQTFDPITATSTSGGKSRRQGLDFDLRFRPSEVLDLSTNWTFTDAKYRQLITEDGDTLNGARVFNTARYTGTATVDITPRQSRLSVRLATNVVGPYTPFDLPGVELPSYALVHVTFGLRLGTTLLQIGARNLFDHKYPEVRAGDFVSPGQPISVFGTMRYFF